MSLDLNLAAFRESRRAKNEENRKNIFNGKIYTEPTQACYKFTLRKWKQFGAALGSDPEPDVETLQTFMRWYAQIAKGRINERIALSSLDN